MGGERCETCRYWRDGGCYRHAPRPVRFVSVKAELTADLTLEDTFAVSWPATDEHDWCGEWSARVPLPVAPADGAGGAIREAVAAETERCVAAVREAAGRLDLDGWDAAAYFTDAIRGDGP